MQENRSILYGKCRPTGEFDFYEIEYQLGTEPFRYYFEIKKGTEICYFSRYGVTYRQKSTIPLLSSRDFPHRNGQKGRSCIRFL